MKSIDVVAAVIIRDGKAFATQRGYGEFEGGWEFPGGKVEPGETPGQALVREIAEELDMHIGVGELLTVVDYDYPSFHLHMACYLCEMDPRAQPRLLEHEAARWLDRAHIDSVEWLPADIQVIDALKASDLLS